MSHAFEEKNWRIGSKKGRGEDSGVKEGTKYVSINNSKITVEKKVKHFSVPKTYDSKALLWHFEVLLDVLACNTEAAQLDQHALEKLLGSCKNSLLSVMMGGKTLLQALFVPPI